jgi:hypothetical protein
VPPMLAPVRLQGKRMQDPGVGETVCVKATSYAGCRCGIHMFPTSLHIRPFFANESSGMTHTLGPTCQQHCSWLTAPQHDIIGHHTAAARAKQWVP